MKTDWSHNYMYQRTRATNIIEHKNIKMCNEFTSYQICYTKLCMGGTGSRKVLRDIIVNTITTHIGEPVYSITICIHQILYLVLRT